MKQDGWMIKVAVAIGFGVLLYLSAPLLDRYLVRALPGQPCEVEGARICRGNEALLVCVQKVWVEQPCRGTRGCTGRHLNYKQGNQSEPSVCDTSRNQEGDTCFGDAPACAEGSKTVLVCEGGRLAKKPCPAGCHANACP